MAESDKADASTGKTKAKTSFLDDDISKDFLSSWKSTAGSDMDFNFEPVTKGNKKAFDFGMDMDFSLDDAFGKMSSFKLDMPDIDFSSSPKKSPVSKENKSESKLAKESGQEKNDKFTFSFDFDGFGDFSLDDFATKGGKNATEGKTSKQASPLSKSECEDLPNQAASSEPRKEDATQKERSKSELSEVAVDSKHGLSVEQEKSPGASSLKGPSNSTIAVHQQKQTQMSMNKTVPVDALQPDPKSPMAGETDSKISKTQASSHDCSSDPESNPSHKLVDSEEAFVSPKTTKITSAEGVEEDFHFTEKKTSKQMSPDVKEQAPLVKVSEEPFASPETDRITTARGMEEDFHLTEEKALKQVFAEVKEQASMVKVSEEAFASPETDRILTARGIEEDFHLTEEKTSKQVFAEVKEQAPMVNISALLATGSKASDDETSLNEKIGDGTSEVETLQEEFAAGAPLGTDSITTNPDRSSHQCFTEKTKSEEERVAGVSEKLDNHTLTLDTLSSTISKRMNSEVSLNAKLQKSDVKDPPAPSESKPTSAKSMKMRFKLSEANNFSMARGTNDGAGKKHFILEKSKKGSASSLGAADLSGDSRNEGNGGKLDGNPSSCAKELMKRDSAVERREKRTDVSRDGDSNESGEIQTKMVADAVLGDRQAKKDSFHLLDTRKISIDVKPHSQLPSVVAPEREAKSSNHRSGKLNDKISSISIAQKSNFGQVNRLVSSRTDKTVPTLPSLKISRNTVNKQSASSIVQTPKSMVNFEKSARLEEKTKIVSPVNVLRQTPSVSSLKRKATEVADPQPSKRHLVSESRMPNVSPREVENEVKTRVTLCEGSKKNVTAENRSPKFDFHLEENMENLGFTLMVESDENVEKAEACAKELDDICSMLKKKHDEAKELLVRALVNNNNLLMLNHPIYEKKILEVQKFASRLMSREQAAGV